VTFHPVTAPTSPYVDHGEVLTSGEAIFYRRWATNDITMTTQTVFISYWVAASNGSSDHFETVTGGTAATAITYANMGIYTIDASGNLTLAASTGDVHASVWGSTFTGYNVALTTKFTRVAGVRYAAGILAVGAGVPALSGSSGNGTYYGLAPVLGATVTGQATLPASIVIGNISSNFQAVEAVLTP
jgi:hypothetical protein